MLGERAIHHMAVKVVDFDACVRFYRDMLGLPLLQSHADGEGGVRSVWLRLGHGAILMLERATEPGPRSPGGWHLLALSITRAERDHLEAWLPKQGIPVTGRTAYTLYIADPEGNRIGLSHYPTL